MIEAPVRATERKRRVYTGDRLRAVAMPLGGLGTGTIALAGDGSLRQWQIHNQVNHLGLVPDTFFAVWTKGYWVKGLKPPIAAVSRVLQSAALYDSDGPPAPPTSNDHVVPTAHRKLLEQLPGVADITYTGEYPIAELSYHDPELPLEITLEAFNPFIPLNSKDSALPAILFNFTVHNPTDRTLSASVAASLQNAVGWDGVAPISDNHCQLYGGNVNGISRLNNQTIVTMSNAWLPGDDSRNGTMALAVDAPDATYLTQWADRDTFWEDFSADGELANVTDSSPSAAGSTWNGALAVPFVLSPGESRTVRFTLAWHFPNRYVNWSQVNYFEFMDTKSKFWLGNQYNNWFRSALDVVSYVDTNRERLTAETRQARDTLFDSSLPAPLIDAVTSQMSIARTPTCFWIEDGNFYGFEGCNGASTPRWDPVEGSCPLNCTHVWNYEMSLARLFPDLERTMRDTEWRIQQHPSGFLPHRVIMPTYLPRPWDIQIGGPANPALDGLFGAFLKTYREYLASGDDAWLAATWPNLKLAMDHVWTEHDPNKSGVIAGEQPNTYDISIYGVNTFIGTLYLAALRVMEELARRQGETEYADDLRAVFERGRAQLEAQVWNGEYYVQDVDFEQFPEQNWGQGCHADQLLGQWWAHLLGLGHLLEPDHVRSAAKAIVAHNFRTDFRGFVQAPRVYCTEDDQGLLICTWPNGGRPEVVTQYSDEVWTGIEYAVAGVLLQEGEPELAMQVISAVRDRYDGSKQNPWNDIECGDHYVRAMSSWGLLEAASGYHYDAAAATVAFAPVIGAGDFRAPFVTRDGWGTFSQTAADGTLTAMMTIAYGSLSLESVSLAPEFTPGNVTVTLDGAPVSATIRQENDKVAVHYDASVTIPAGQTLTVELTA
jgi:uncharacterized protein (DUF608 family)